MRSDETLIRLFERHRYRDDVFCHLLDQDVERAITFRAFFAHAGHFRTTYLQEGIEPGSLIIIATDYSAESMFAFVGAMLAGCTPAFLAPLTAKQDPEVHRATIAAIFRYTRPAAIVVSPGFAPDLDLGAVSIITAELQTEATGDPDPCGPDPWPTPCADATAFLQFSSGTTGLRKGVMLSHRAVVAQIAALAETVPLGSEDRIASWLPLYHDMGLIACFITPLALGIPLALQDPIAWSREPARLFAAIERHRATHCWLPNFAFNHLRLTVPKSARFDLSSMKAFVSCSEPCKAATFDAFLDRFAAFGVGGAQLATSYAMAETVFAVTYSAPGRPTFRLRCDRDAFAGGTLVPGGDDLELLATGRLLPGLRLAVLDTDGAHLPDGGIGQIALAGDFVFGGYYENADATASAFRDGWFLTGDLGATWNGELFITGREKDVIIVNGRNFYAHDIEAVASGVPGVKPGRAVAFAVENVLLGSEEVVIIAETERGPGDYRGLAAAIKKSVSADLNLTAVRPHIVSLSWLIKTTSGKISRSENRSKYLAQ